MNILITGAKGQLGSEIKVLSTNYSDHTFFFEDSSSLNITDKQMLLSYITKYKINAVINCAAYTKVDKAEEEIEKAELVNSIGVSNLLDVLAQVSGKLIHISTDYVFDGDHFFPYKESDLTNPKSVYGKTKLKGEQFIFNSKVESIVIRTSWLYSSYGVNFVKTMKRLAESRETINVVYDQVGSPTYAKCLATVCLSILFSNVKLDSNSKLYHYSNLGVASWFDFAKAIMEFFNLNCNVQPIESKDFPTLAPRPYYSVLNTEKIRTDFNIEIPYWRDALKECIYYLKID